MAATKEQQKIEYDEGFRIGVLMAKKEVAKKLYEDGYPLELIERLTKLSKEDIVNLCQRRAE